MEINKGIVIEWLESTHRTRDWLAKRCQVSRRTVDNWLVSPRDIPKAMHKLIENLMEEDEKAAKTIEEQPSYLTLRFTYTDFGTIQDAARRNNKRTDDWAAQELLKLSEKEIFEVMDGLAAEDPAPYKQSSDSRYDLKVQGKKHRGVAQTGHPPATPDEQSAGSR